MLVITHPKHVCVCVTGAQELQKRLQLIRKEQKLIKEEAKQQKSAALAQPPAPAQQAGTTLAAATASPTPATVVAEAVEVVEDQDQVGCYCCYSRHVTTLSTVQYYVMLQACRACQHATYCSRLHLSLKASAWSH